MPIYALIVGKNGPKLQSSPDGDTNIKGAMMMRPGHLTANGISMALLSANLSNMVGRVVVDKTGLPGVYDFTLEFTPERGQGGFFAGAPGPGPEGKEMPPPPDPNAPSIFTALQEQLGLKLDSQKGPVDMFVIDRIEKPTEN